MLTVFFHFVQISGKAQNLIGCFLKLGVLLLEALLFIFVPI